MTPSPAWIVQTPGLTYLSGLDHRRAFQTLGRDAAAIAAMHSSRQWPEAQRWAERWASSDRGYERALRCGFAAQHDVQTGVMALSEAERWALPSELRRVSYWDWRAATPIRGADLGTAAFAGDWVETWLNDLERHILPAAPTHAAHEILTTTGVQLLTWLGNHLSRLPTDGIGDPDSALRSVRRAWVEIAPPGITRVQTDSVRRLYLGSCANGYQSGRSIGVVQWIARGRTIEQARSLAPLATSWAVAVDQADPSIAQLSREALKRRQWTVRSHTQRHLTPPREAEPKTAEAPAAGRVTAA
jgi:hypothetical protein